MKKELTNNELRIFKEIENITLTDYEIQNNLIEIDSLITMLEDLKVEYDSLQEEYQDFKNYIDNKEDSDVEYEMYDHDFD